MINYSFLLFVRLVQRGGFQSIIFAFLSIPLLAQEGPQAKPARQVTPEQGTVSESGKFQPNEASAMAALTPTLAPDPVARLAELGIQLKGDQIVIGLVKLDRKAHTVSFPVKINAVSGVIEYALVHANGKIHETLLVTDALPKDIHVACLLAGWGKLKAEISSSVIVEVVWETNGPQRREPLENLIAFAKGSPQGKHGGHLKSGPWSYSGSKMDTAGFAASREGSIISLISDPAALVTNPRPGKKDDSLHIPNSKQLPVQGLPLTMILRSSPAKLKVNHSNIIKP